MKSFFHLIRRVEGEKLISKRLLRKTSSAPRWMEMVIQRVVGVVRDMIWVL